MRTVPVPVILALALALTPAPVLADKAARAARRTFTFDDGTSGAPPAEFSFGRTGSGKQGRWAIVADPSAPSGKIALAQLDADRTDSCGLVFRYIDIDIDADNYYVTRADAPDSVTYFDDLSAEPL
jgi:hypothetical protein